MTISRGTMSVLERSRSLLEALGPEEVSLGLYKALSALQEALEVVALAPSMDGPMLSVEDLMRMAKERKAHADHSMDTTDEREAALGTDSGKRLGGLDKKPDPPGRYLYL